MYEFFVGASVFQSFWGGAAMGVAKSGAKNDSGALVAIGLAGFLVATGFSVNKWINEWPVAVSAGAQAQVALMNGDLTCAPGDNMMSIVANGRNVRIEATTGEVRAVVLDAAGGVDDEFTISRNILPTGCGIARLDTPQAR